MRRLLVLLAFPLAACGGGGGPTRPPLDVAAAASLRPAFAAYARTFAGAEVKTSFSSAPASAVRRTPRPDVVAAPAAKLPALYRAGLVEQPQVLGSNDLALAVPKRNQRVNGLARLYRPGARLAIVTGASPAAVSTRMVFARLKPAQRAAIEANVRFRVASSAAAARLVETRRADAGLVYTTDATDLLAISLPDYLARHMTYGVAVVKGARHLGAARRFVASLKTPDGSRALRQAGLSPGPPRPP
jgi:ABC-type molybdate transport system substrate-binding protein